MGKKKDVQIEAEKLERIKTILLAHQGKESAITSKAISSIMGFPMEDTQVCSRSYIWETAKKYQLPVVSCSKGYFIAVCDEEMHEYNEDIRNRLTGMIKTRDMTNENYKIWKKQLTKEKT